MDKNEWEAINRHRAVLADYVNVREAVFYLKSEIQVREPPQGTNFSPLDLQQESDEIDEFQDHNSVKSLLEYLRRRKSGFDLLCSALKDSEQEFLAQVLTDTKDSIPEVDAPNFYVPDSRRSILVHIKNKLQTGRSYMNIHGEQGVGTSCFLEQIIRYLEQECYFKVYRIDLTDTPLILQQKYFTKVKHELLSKKQAMKKFCVFCVDNCSSTLLQQLPNHQKHQTRSVATWITSCRKDLGISLLTTASHRIEGLDNIAVNRLSVTEMGIDIQRMFTKISDSELKELTSIFPKECNPLDCFLMSTLFMLHQRKAAHHVVTLLNKHPADPRNELFAAVFNKLTRTQQDILLSVYSLPCNAKVSIPSIYSLYHGSSRPPEEHHIQILETDISELVHLNLLHQDGDRYSMKDSNFFYHFRAFFQKKHPKKLRVYYLRGLHHYLDYTIKIIQDVHSLSEFNQTQEVEWKDTIPRVSFVLDPSERSLERALLARRELIKPVYNKRMFVIEKLRNIALHIPNETLILAAHNILEDFDTHHHKYADIEDKAKLLCLITELSLTPDCNSVDARANLQKAMSEVKNLLAKTHESAPALRIKYYLRLLIPLGEIYVNEKSFDKARNCFRECLKLKCDNKTINWVLRKRLKFVNEMLKNSPSSYDAESPTGTVSPMSPVDITSKNFLSQDIKYHLEMGDNFYVRGDFTMAFNYYFELWRKFHSQHLHLKEQEYILVTMGHLKLQKRPKLYRAHVLDAIQFYEQSNKFYYLRKNHNSEFLKICIVTANLLAGKRRMVRDMMIEFRNAHQVTKTEFFLAIIHKDTSHRFLWRELTYTEKEHQTNRIKPAIINYYMLEGHHYSIKRSQFKTNDLTRFLEFPSPEILDSVDKFAPDPLYNQDDVHLAVYIKIPTTRI